MFKFTNGKKTDSKHVLKWEKLLLDWIENNIFLLGIVITIILGFVVRYSLRGFISLDSTDFLLPWYEEIEKAGGVKALKYQVGNYNILYQFLIALMTYLPIEPLSAYKSLSCLFDYLLAGCLGAFVLSYIHDRWKGFFAFALVIFSPLVILNSAVWAQCDSIYVFFGFFSLFMLIKKKYILSFVLLGISFSFKLQAIFFVPVFLYIYFKKKEFSILNFIAVPIVMCISSLPGLIQGRSLLSIFSIYYEQQDTYKSMFMNYPSFWALLCNGLEENYQLLKGAAIILTIVILGGIMIWCTVQKVEMTNENIIFLSLLLIYTVLLFLPSMHERYSYGLEIISILVAFLSNKTLPLSILLQCISLFTYGNYLFGTSINLVHLSVVNMAIYFIYILILTRQMSDGKKISDACFCANRRN